MYAKRNCYLDWDLNKFFIHKPLLQQNVCNFAIAVFRISGLPAPVYFSRHLQMSWVFSCVYLVNNLFNLCFGAFSYTNRFLTIKGTISNAFFQKERATINLACTYFIWKLKQVGHMVLNWNSFPSYSPCRSPYISYGTSKENLSKYQDVSSLVIVSFIPITWMFEQAVMM